MKREYNIHILLGIALLLLGIAVEVIWNGFYSPLTSGFVATGIVLIIGSAVKHLKFGEAPDRDERTMKLNAFALAYAWLFTFAFMSLLILLDHYVVKLTVIQALISTMAVTILVATLFRCYFLRKGDVE
ncbi:MAG: hypothetical protein PHH85_11190 [Candidatus Methanoperedens sp.]|nr:hypothetical protein [Candidatus Methanoperedens sp.]